MALTLQDRLLVISKLCLSFAKRDWGLGDYPAKIQEQLLQPESASGRWKPQKYMAFILKWGLAGTGNSEQDAWRDLERNFEAAKAERRKKQEMLPRPGTSVPAQFASAERVNVHAELAADFIQRVLHLDWAWISDESSLWDFHHDETNDALIARIREMYEVDVSDIPSAKLYEILDRIAAAKSP